MKLRIRSLTGQTIEMDEVDDSITVSELKARLEDQEAIPAAVQRLIFSGQELTDASTLKEANVNDDGVIHLVVRQTRDLSPEEVARQVPVSSGDLHVAIPSFGAPDHIVAGITPAAFGALQVGRVVKMFAVIDSIFILVWSLSQPALIFALILPLCGYYGSTNYNYIFVFAYEYYLALNIAYRSYLNVAMGVAPAFIVLNSLGIFLELYIAFIVMKFIRSVKALQHEDREQLRRLEQLR